MRKFTEILITDNDEENATKFDLAQRKIKQLVAIRDTTVGVHFHFENNAKYKSFIRALDICKIEKANIFFPHENDLWIFHYVPQAVNPKDETKDPERIYGRCGNSEMRCCVVYTDSKEMAKWERKERIVQCIKVIKQFWLVGVVFVLLSITSIRKLRRL
ncbi:MAG TPA: hypothetical protein VFF27_03215 [Bacteroidia bacterium]|nr:hypothetical protein [Bacteroidia bacterium]